MLFIMWIMLIMMFFVGMYSFYMKSDHLLNMLLSLEYFSIIIFSFMVYSLWTSSEKFILIYFLTFCVCEGAFGLSILVSLVRSFGNDYLQSLMFLKC
uniref:NADH-ubiquinone oxidoreductase chain 4L n=1 Tax=Teliapsocus conterminus TaxID=1407779 RepID=A0A8K2AU19_9NEOP|nr:NADH dehydrogenase subunit 4L [Teliapsocus conterminus]